MGNSEKVLQVFLDSNVLIAGLAFPRWPYEILKYGEAQVIKVVLCPFVIEEVQTRISDTFPDCLEKFNRFIASGKYKVVSNPSKAEVKKHHNIVRDKQDIPVVLAAVKAKVDYLVSHDKDLTSQDHTTKELRQYIQPLQPGTFLKEVMSWTSEELEAIRHRTWRDIA